MHKRHCILYMFVCVMLCACQGRTSEQESAYGKTEQSRWPQTESEPADADTEFLEKYSQIIAEMNGGRTALLYLDDDAVPELLLLKDGEYQLYFYDGSEAKNIPLPDAGMKADAKCRRKALPEEALRLLTKN